MAHIGLRKGRAASVLAAATLAATLSVSAQTPIKLHSNKYTPKQDVELGREAAAEVRKELPMLDDRQIENFVENIGDRLANRTPPEFRQPEFRYSFDVVNLKDINAFALPGGPMFLNRGMIEAARTDGEVAGVMAHELSHVILRHGTAQATKGEKFQIGSVLGQIAGAVIGGRTGNVIGQAAQIGPGVYFLKYGREYEREADLLGARIMASAGYDPRQMANMFQTIERQKGGGGPEFLSSHPNPGNRYEAINREAASLRVEGSAGSPAEFNSVQARLRQMSPALTAEQVARGKPSPRHDPHPVGTGGRVRVDPPSDQWRTHQPGELLRISVPANWQQMGSGSTVTYAPEGGYFQEGQQTAFTHGVEVGVMPNQNGNLQQATDDLLRSFAKSNPDLRRQGGYQRTTIAGRQGLSANLTNISVHREQEFVNLSTTQLRDGSLLFMIGVSPENEARTYQNTFNRVRQSLQISDGGR